jgi:hypothetical protein
MTCFGFLVVYRPKALEGFVVAGAIGFAGSAIYFIRAKVSGAWPFVRPASLLHPPYNERRRQ